ncbi:MAG: Probable exported protease, partial [uncultured Nocardioides sp.]
EATRRAAARAGPGPGSGPDRARRLPVRRRGRHRQRAAAPARGAHRRRRGAGVGHHAARSGARRPLRPGAVLGVLRGRPPVLAADRAGRLRRADRRHRRDRPAQGAGRPAGAARRLARGQPRRPRRPRHVVRRGGRPSLPPADHRPLRRGRLRSARHGAERSGGLPDRRGARRLPRHRPGARRPRGGARGRRLGRAVRRRLRAALRPPGGARDDRRGRPRHGRAAVGPRRGAARLLRCVLRHQARGDVRRALPRPGGAPRARRRRRRLARQPPAEPRPGRRLRAGAAGLRGELHRLHRLLLPRRRRGAGSGDHHRAGRVHRRPAAADRLRPRADRRQGVLRHRHAALQPRLLVPPLRCAALGAGRRRRGADGAVRPLRLPRPRGLHRQQRRGDLRHQLPRRPLRHRAVRGAGRVRRLRGGLAHLRPDLRLGPDRLRRPGGRAQRARARHRRGGGRPDRGRRHHPRPRHAVRVGRGARGPARVRRAGQQGRRRAHGLQRRERLRGRGGRGLPRRRRRPRRRPLLL